MKEIHQTLESKMRQIFLGIYQLCSNCPRFQIIPEFYTASIPAHQNFLEKRYFLVSSCAADLDPDPYVFELPDPDPFVSVTDPNPVYHQAKIVRKRNFPTNM